MTPYRLLAFVTEVMKPKASWETVADPMNASSCPVRGLRKTTCCSCTLLRSPFQTFPSGLPRLYSSGSVAGSSSPVVESDRTNVIVSAPLPSSPFCTDRVRVSTVSGWPPITS